ncbi:hypothetical protein [Methylobacterium sp. ID0610]|uniref:hypothetical protein n=1 Tax=Methylobacterium carpenticola TaxID=3344827 RepID=UPI00368072F2
MPKSRRRPPAAEHPRACIMVVRSAPPEIGVLIEADRRFFERFPERSHRIRHMAPVEVQFFCEHVDALPPLLDGMRWFVAVKQITPGSRDRIPFQGPTNAEVDMTETQARGLYDVARRAAGGADSFGIVDLRGAE